ncbi:MAG: hypothetical protein GY771_08430, partial [bacterium]|nr:hypothetical protein [bacterium]
MVFVFVFVIGHMLGISFYSDAINNWSLVVAGLSAIGGFVVSWFLPYRIAQI